MKTSINILLLLFTFVVSSSYSFAFEFIVQPTVDGRMLVGKFLNGARFVYKEDLDGKRGSLSYLTTDSKETLVHEGVLIKLPQEVKSERRAYTPLLGDEAVFFRGATNYVLTDKGIWAEVFENRLRFVGKNFSVKAQGLNFEGESYALVSARYHDDHVHRPGHSGETYLVRLSDGEVRFLARDFYTQSEVRAIKIENRRLVSPKYKKSKRRKLSFPMSQFEASHREYNVKYVPPKKSNDSPRDILVTGSETSADGKEFPEQTWEFENGTRLEITFGSEKGVNFVSKKGHKKRLIDAEVIYYPSISQTTNTSYIAPKELKVVLIETTDGVFSVTDKGEVASIPFDRSKVRSKEYFKDAFVDPGTGTQYFLVSFSHGGDTTDGETFVIREDGEALRVDYRKHEFAVDMKKFMIQDGILMIDNSNRLVDLKAFDGELRFQTKPYKETILMSEGESSEEVDTVEYVEKKFENVLEDLKHSRTFDLMKSDSETVENTRRGLLRGSVVIVGDSGTGKTQFVKSFLAGVARGDYPEIPRTTKVISLDAVTLNSGAKFVGMLEGRMEALLEYAKMFPVILMVDELAALRGVGTHSGNQNDIFQYLKKPLEEGWLRIIGTTTKEEFNNHFGGDSALERRFKLVTKSEPTDSDLLVVLKSGAKKEGYKVPSNNVLERVVQLSNEFNAIGAQPAKAVALLTAAYDRQILNGTKSKRLTIEDIETTASLEYNADKALFDPEIMKKRVEGLPTFLQTRVIGQGHVKGRLVQRAKQRFAGVHDSSRPGIMMLLFGHRGLGKTELAKAYAEYIDVPVKIVEMNKYANGGVERFRFEVYEALSKNAFTVLIFDELEKASIEVQNAMLAMLQEGFFEVQKNMDTTGRNHRTVKVSTRNASIFATSNAAADFPIRSTQGKRIGFVTSRKPNVEATPGIVSYRTEDAARALTADGVLSVPLVDRFQELAGYVPPSKKDFADVVKLHLKLALKELTATKGVEILMEDRFQETYVEDTAKQYFKNPGLKSNREAPRMIEGAVRSALADAFLSGKLKRGDSVVLEYNEGKIVVINSSCGEILTGF